MKVYIVPEQIVLVVTDDHATLEYVRTDEHPSETVLRAARYCTAANPDCFIRAPNLDPPPLTTSPKEPE